MINVNILKSCYKVLRLSSVIVFLPPPRRLCLHSSVHLADSKITQNIRDFNYIFFFWGGETISHRKDDTILVMFLILKAFDLWSSKDHRPRLKYKGH